MIFKELKKLASELCINFVFLSRTTFYNLHLQELWQDNDLTIFYRLLLENAGDSVKC